MNSLDGVDPARVAFLAAAALHLGFQATVTRLVYPVLARVRAVHWRESHDRHRRAIAPVVAVVYAVLLATAAWLVAVDRSVPTLVAIVPVPLVVLLTALVGTRLHRQLVRRDPAVLARLLGIDRLRLALAVLAVAGAVVTVLR